MNGFGWYIYRFSLWSGSLPELVASIKASGAKWVAPRVLGWYLPDLQNQGYLDEFYTLCRQAGLQIGGWGYNTLCNSRNIGMGVLEAEATAAKIKEYDLDFWIVNAEKELKHGIVPWYGWKKRDRVLLRKQAGLFWSRLRALIPMPFEIGMTSYRYPSLHWEFIWHAMTDPKYVSFHQPQIYWEQDVREVAGSSQLLRSYNDYQAKGIMQGLPFRPIAPSYPRGGWFPTVKQIEGFGEMVNELSLDAAGIYTFEHATDLIRGQAKAIFAGLGDNGYIPPPVPADPPADAVARLWAEAIRRGWDI